MCAAGRQQVLAHFLAFEEKVSEISLSVEKTAGRETELRYRR